MHLSNKHVFKRMEEFELSERCRQGDNLARKELYERYAGRLLVVCIRYIGDKDRAQDIMHDGFIQIFSSFDKFVWRGEGSLRAWLEKVMMNTALMNLRRKDVMNQTTEIEDFKEQYREPEISELEQIPQEVLLKLISELPDGYRMVFNMYTFEKKSHKEIAQVLGINERTSSSQLYRAKNYLIKRIWEYLDRRV